MEFEGLNVYNAQYVAHLGTCGASYCVRYPALSCILIFIVILPEQYC